MRIPRAKGTPPNMNGPYAHRGPPANSVLASVMCVLQPFLAGDGVPPTANMRTYHRPIASQVCTHRPRIVVSCDRTLRTAHCKVHGALIHHSLACNISTYFVRTDRAARRILGLSSQRPRPERKSASLQVSTVRSLIL